MSKLILKQTNFVTLIMLLFLLFITGGFGYSQQKVTGHIISKSENMPLPGVTVVLKGSNIGTVTDLDGNFSIKVNSEEDILAFSMVGFVAQEIKVGTQTTINIGLETQITDLDEVVVIGYGVVKKSDLTGSVASVKSKDLTAIPVTNALEALQGKVTGLDLTKSSGQAGAAINITVRGNRSITAGNKPLIIVDGVDYGDNMDVNPNDIQSVEVLKDASSTAIYGSRGANGVILITTKRGTVGKSKISINSYYGTNVKSLYPEFTSGPQWMDLRREANSAEGRTSGVWSTMADDPKIFNKYALDGLFVDWRDLLIHEGNQQNHQVSISGGNDNTTYSISGEYGEEQGILKFDNLTRYGGRVSIDHKVNKWLKVGSSMSFALNDQNIRANPFNQANKIAPVGYPYDTLTGEINAYPVYDGNVLNPLIEEKAGVKKDNKLTKRYFSANYLEIRPLSNLSLKTSLGVDFTDSREGIYSGSMSFSQLNTVSKVSVENKTHSNILWENVATYYKTFDIHEIEFMTGTSTQIKKDEKYYGEGKDLLSADMDWYALQNTKSDKIISSLYGKDQMVSFFGRLNYKLLNRYLLTGTLRWDGASVLPPGHQGQIFPSVAVAWKINEENFLKNVDFLSSLKIRLSYGLSGNSSVDRYATQGFLGQSTFSFDENPAYGYYPKELPNKNLGWETTASRDIGLDFGLFKNRITGSVNFYNQSTYDLLLKRSVPPSSGYVNLIDNVGETENNGIEVNLSTVNIDMGNNGFKWSTDLNFSLNREKIIKLSMNTDLILDKDYANTFKAWQVGQPVNSFYDYEKIGIWQLSDSVLASDYGFLPGDIRLNDLNGDTLINADDRVIRGHTNPDWTMGINNSISFKGIEVSCFVYARIGQTISYEGYSGWKYAGDANTTIVDYWTYRNPTNFFPRPGNAAAGANTKKYISSLSYIDGSFVKIRDITVAYSVPQKWLEKINVSKVRVYSTWKNYFTFNKLENYDTERGGDLSFPMTKQWVFGINLDF
jgi:TonB-dependent starch-binding outer membrane protein SusC